MDIALSIMKWPLIACLLLPIMLVYFGLHIVRREVIFVDLALAQVAALGTALCLMLGHDAHEFHTYVYSVGFTVVGAAIFAMTRNTPKHRVPQEALIGIVYVVAAATGILLLSRSAEGNEELKKTLIGDVLLVSKGQVLKTFALYVVIGVVHWIFRRKFLALSFEPERAEREGLAVRWWDFLFYSLFGLVVTSFLQIGGVLLVFSYLIVPAVCANFLAQRLGSLLLVGWLVATVASVVGLFASYEADLPTGAAIVCSLGATLIIVGLIARLRGRGKTAR
ncbi:MAG TPA: iron chelate uptake ABC transporter family permease subunit [Verrucomicrobiae bacterium]|jgi:zinc/manganese transport system permease protein